MRTLFDVLVWIFCAALTSWVMAFGYAAVLILRAPTSRRHVPTGEVTTPPPQGGSGSHRPR